MTCLAPPVPARPRAAGIYEALELRDKGDAYMGKGVTKVRPGARAQRQGLS